MRALILLLLLAGCGQANGPQYSGEKGIIVYTDYAKHGGLYSRNGTWEVKAHGMICDLHDKAFFIIPSGPTEITATNLGSGISRISVNDNKPHYIRIDVNVYKSMLSGLGVVPALLATHDDGPYIFTDIPKSQAIQELQGLHRDCL